LAEKLGISRTQLRDVLASLEREGFITRRHGVGTIINKHVLTAQARMDIEVEFLEMIRRCGYTPGEAFVRFEDSVADERIAGHLHIPVGTPVLKIIRLCTADGRPAIYCEDTLERSRVTAKLTQAELALPFFQFLQHHCGIIPYLDLTDLRPVAANEKLAELLQVPVGAPLLHMDEVDYDIEGNPVFCSEEYFADGFFRHTVLRKKL
jgi:GntR family transcriptional regulator